MRFVYTFLAVTIALSWCAQSFGGTRLTYKGMDTSQIRKGGQSESEITFNEWVGERCFVYDHPDIFIAIDLRKMKAHVLNTDERTFEEFDVSAGFETFVAAHKRVRHDKFMSLFSPIVEVRREESEARFEKWKSKQRVHVEMISVASKVQIVADFWETDELPVDIDVYSSGVTALRNFSPISKSWLDQRGEVTGISVYREIKETHSRGVEIVKKTKLIDVEEQVDVDGQKCGIPEGFREVPADYGRFLVQ